MQVQSTAGPKHLDENIQSYIYFICKPTKANPSDATTKFVKLFDCFECNGFGNVTRYNMHEYEGVFSTVPLLTMQRHLPFELLFTATSLEGSLQVRLTKLPDI